MQFDEKWDFVGQKEKNCAPDEDRRGDCWNHVALDPESRLVVSLVVGKRTEDATHALVGDFHRRTGGRVMRLMPPSDDREVLPGVFASGEKPMAEQLLGWLPNRWLLNRTRDSPITAATG